MAFFAEVNIPGFVNYSAIASPFALEGIAVKAKADFKAVFEEHRHRVYSLAFWMTDNEMTAEEISTRTFLRAFHGLEQEITAQAVDAALLRELREHSPIGNLTLEAAPVATKSVAGNTKRADLERAVVQVPATERLAFLLHDVEGYDHTRISRLLGITEDESKKAVFQARLKIRELVAKTT
jgi:RNA polymerase sigma-70 factor (ECF subfamily)